MDYQDIFLETTDSTNRVARELGQKGGAHGSGVMAETQTGGRGRRGREWFSPPGKNLYCSYLVRPDIRLDDYPKLTMVAGVAAVQCLQEISDISMGLKWPNDLYMKSRKCGGILCESSLAPGDSYGVIGIGINCNLSDSDLPEELKEIATSLFIESGVTIDPRQLFGALREDLLDTIRDFEDQGFAEILTRWNRYDLFYGKRMTWVREDGKPVSGINLGPEIDGTLLVEDDDGNRHRVMSGDVTLAGPLP